MPKIEQRVVGASRPKVGAQRIGGARESEPAAPVEEPAEKKRGKAWIFVSIALVVALAAAAYFFIFSGDDADAGPQEPVAGVVQQVESMSLNLVDGHYLRLGLGLQLVEGIEGVDESQARDAAITLFSGRTIKDVSSPDGRAELKVKLTQQLTDLYDGDVMGVYLTDFVTQ